MSAQRREAEDAEARTRGGAWAAALHKARPTLIRPALLHPEHGSRHAATKPIAPYVSTCRQRVRLERQRWREQLLQEKRSMEASQQRAVDGVRMYRVLGVGFRADTRLKDPLAATERRRLEALLFNRLSFP